MAAKFVEAHNIQNVDPLNNVVIQKSENEKSELAAAIATKPSAYATLNDLPLTVLVHILSYLSFCDIFNMECVSRKMEAAVVKAWKDVRGISTRTEFECSELANKYHCACEIDDELAKVVVKRGDIKYLAAGPQIGVTSDILSAAALMPNLETIYFEKIALKNSDVTALSHCLNLKHVTLKSCFRSAGFELSLTKFFQKSTNLTHVDLSKNVLYGNCFVGLPSTLQYLNISGNPKISLMTTFDIVQKCQSLLSFVFDVNDRFCDRINMVLYSLPKVKSLRIFVSDLEAAASLDFSRNPDLEVLQFLNNGYTGETTFKSLENCKKLRSIYFHNSHAQDDSKLRLLAGCKSLKVLYASGIINLNVMSEVVQLCGIRYLRLASDKPTSRESVSAFVNATPTLKGIHYWIKKPSIFPHIFYMIRPYFTDELEAMWKSDGTIDINRPIFSKNSFIRQSDLEKFTLDSPEYDEEYNIFEFGERT